jgi:hypothetical protein
VEIVLKERGLNSEKRIALLYDYNMKMIAGLKSIPSLFDGLITKDIKNDVE